jgi:hypothetical protein
VQTALPPVSCPPGQLLSVLPTLVFSLSLFYVLLNPLAPFSRDYFAVAEIIMFVEVSYITMMLLRLELAGDRQACIVFGIVAGLTAASIYSFAKGVGIAALVVGFQMLGRILREADAPATPPPPPLESKDWKAFFPLRSWPAYAALFSLVIVGVLESTKVRFPPHVQAELKATGVDVHGNGIFFLTHAALYFLFMTFWEVYMLPCARSARSQTTAPERPTPLADGVKAFAAEAAAPRRPAESALVNAAETQRTDAILARLAAAGASAEDVHEARRVLFRAPEALVVALETPDSARALLITLARGGDGQLGAARALAFAEMALRLSGAGEATLGVIGRLISADARMTAMELSLYLLARARLAGVPAPKADAPAPAALAPEREILLALIRSGEGLTPQAVIGAVDKLQTLDLMPRAKLAGDCMRAAGDRMTDTQRALLRSLFVALDCPLPDALRVTER